MSDPAGDPDALNKALERDDALALAKSATDEELRRVERAEVVLGLAAERRKRTKRTAQIAQALVGYVALAGFFANAYQNFNNKRDSEARARAESERWEKEFKRAQDSDKYHAFFETSALATDPQNADRRLVGYALLKEFVDDKAYNGKAIIMLEESLALELRGDTADHGLDEQRRLSVMAILAALAHTSDCRALASAARSVERIARLRPPVKHGAAAPPEDLDQLAEVYGLYVRRLVGAGARACGNLREFREVRRPIREALVQLPALGGLTARPKISDANRRIVELLRDLCTEERQAGVVTDCAEAEQGYAKLCGEMKRAPDFADEAPGCALIAQAIADAAKEVAAPPPDAGE
jgi:hypothetical protein